MKKLLLIPLLGTLLFAPLAQAMPDVNAPNPGRFVADLNATGVFSVTDENTQTAFLLGTSVCVDLFNGISKSDEYQKVTSVKGMTPEMAQALIQTAQADLCPKTLQTVTTPPVASTPKPIGGGIGGAI